ncbi:MAG: kelch repeat-containing protein [Planctomycetota bacterium]
MNTPLILGALGALAAASAAQDLCEGNGYGEAYLEVSPAYIGGFFVHDMGSPQVPFGFGIFSISDSPAETTHPVIGQVCLDVTSPIYQIIPLPLDGSGNINLPLGLPNEPTLVTTLGPFYSNMATFEGGAWSMSKTIPLYFENADSFTPTGGSLSTPRMFHTATYLGQDGRDNRIGVFIAGGGEGTVTVPTAKDSTELYDPLTRTFSPGPQMLQERALHSATLLEDGRVLLAGGLDSSGVCSRTCELYDPATKTLTQTGDLSVERADHSATLLDDGRVLLVGGLQDYQNPVSGFAAALNTSLSTSEIYDPATGTWTLVPGNMQSKRSAHAATKLNDGRVLISGGVRGGTGTGFGSEVPSFTNTCDIYDPALNAYVATASMPVGRALHGHSVLANGDVLITGGTLTAGSYGEAAATQSTGIWNGSIWLNSDPLPVPVAWHRQFPTADGKAHIMGGILGSLSSLSSATFSGIHDGTTFSSGAPIGTNPGIVGAAPDTRGNFTATKLHDGSFLLLGGQHSSTVFDTGFVYTPAP